MNKTYVALSPKTRPVAITVLFTQCRPMSALHGCFDMDDRKRALQAHSRSSEPDALGLSSATGRNLFEFVF